MASSNNDDNTDTLSLNVDIQSNLVWLLPVGFALGACVVIAFDYRSIGWNQSDRRKVFEDLTGDQVDPTIEEYLIRWVDGPRSIANFWGGSVLARPRSKHVCAKSYEVLTLAQALMLTVSVAFYIDSTSSDLLGTVSCLGCCAFWMGTMSSAFFTVTVNVLETQEEFELLRGLYGPELMTVPMILFVWGCFMAFLQLVFYFKTQIDANVSYMCLSVCFLVAPLFFHSLHKMSWAHEIVDAKAEIDREQARALTPEDLRGRFMEYVATKKDNILDMDRDEFLSDLFGKGVKKTSAQQVYASRLFDVYLQSHVSSHYLEEAATSKNGV